MLCVNPRKALGPMGPHPEKGRSEGRWNGVQLGAADAPGCVFWCCHAAQSTSCWHLGGLPTPLAPEPQAATPECLPYMCGHPLDTV